MPSYNPASMINPINIQTLLTPTSIAFTALPAAYSVGVPFAVTARVTCAVAMPSVPVHFFLDGVDIGTQWTSPLNTPGSQYGGYASFTYPAIATAGNHELKASYGGNATFSASVVTLSISVGEIVYTTAITLNSPASAGQDQAFAVSGVLTYVDALGVVQPLVGRTVTVSVTDGSVVATVNVVTDATGAYGASISSSVIGNLNVVASYAGETSLGLQGASARMTLATGDIIIPAALIIGALWYLSKRR